MKRHIGHPAAHLTLCGIYAPHRLLSEGEMGVAFDGCKTCTRLYQRAKEVSEAFDEAVARADRAIARVDAILAQPCCDGRCGR